MRPILLKGRHWSAAQACPWVQEKGTALGSYEGLRAGSPLRSSPDSVRHLDGGGGCSQRQQGTRREAAALGRRRNRTEVARNPNGGSAAASLPSLPVIASPSSSPSFSRVSLVFLICICAVKRLCIHSFTCVFD